MKKFLVILLVIGVLFFVGYTFYSTYAQLKDLSVQEQKSFPRRFHRSGNRRGKSGENRHQRDENRFALVHTAVLFRVQYDDPHAGSRFL